MKRAIQSVATLALLLACAGQAQADLVFFTNRTAFDLAAPGLPVEGFENARSGTAAFTGPLSSTTTNPPSFLPGDILPGVTFVDNPGPQSGAMFVAGPGQSTNPTTAIGQNSPSSDALDLTFSPLVTAVAFDIFQNAGGGAQTGSPQPYPVSVFGPGNVLLGSTTVIVPSGPVLPGNEGFFGVIAINGQQIERVSLNNPNLFDVIDNVAFGQAQQQVIPEPASLALFGMVLLPAAGYYARRRKQMAGDKP